MWSPRRVALSMMADPSEIPKPSFVRAIQALKMLSDQSFNGKVTIIYKAGGVVDMRFTKERQLNEWLAVNSANNISAQLDPDADE